MRETICARLRQSAAVKTQIAEDDMILSRIEEAADRITRCLRAKGTLFLCGNGGSASDAQHIAGELVGRFEMERHGWPAVALSCDGAVMSSIMNDYGAEKVFERQVEAYVRRGDILLGISTSGNSENVYRAVRSARELGAYTIGLLGKRGGRIAAICDLPVIVPSDSTARIQESHITIGHILCELVERRVTE